MRFNSIGRQGNYSQAGKAVADDALNSFIVARNKSPEYGKIAQDAANIAREKKINSIKAQSAVTNTGIAAAAGVKANKIKTEAESNYKSAKRKAGVLAAGGQMISEAGQYLGNKRERRELGDGDSYFNNEIESNNKKIEDLRSQIKPFEASGGLVEEQPPGKTVQATGSGIPAYSPPEGGKTYSKSELQTLAIQGGFTPEEAPLVSRIAMGESSGKSTAFNGKGRDQSYGIMQINMLGDMGPERRAQFGISSNEDLYDPLTNMKAAHSIYKQQGWEAWGAYTNGSYQNH
tara:strand:- start:841 stop:1707 length:867 start_codon:yes stop_codon:yes gene_type:complete